MVQLKRDLGTPQRRVDWGVSETLFSDILQRVEWADAQGCQVDLRALASRASEGEPFRYYYIHAHVWPGQQALEVMAPRLFHHAMFQREVLSIRDFLARCQGMNQGATSSFRCGDMDFEVRTQGSGRLDGCFDSSSRFSSFACWSWTQSLSSPSPRGPFPQLNGDGERWSKLYELVVEHGGMRSCDPGWDERYYGFNVVVADPRARVVAARVEGTDLIIQCDGSSLDECELFVDAPHTVPPLKARRRADAENSFAMGMDSDSWINVTLVRASGENADKAVFLYDLASKKRLDQYRKRRFSIAPKVDGKRVLFVGANPGGLLRVDKEQRVAQDFGGSESSILSLDYLLAASVDDLRRRLLESKFQIIHIASHGEAGGGIVLEDTSGVSQPVSTRALAKMLRRQVEEGGLECVVLNACDSEAVAKEIFDAGVPVVVAMHGEVKDTEAIRFTEGLYHALALGHGYMRAFEEGVTAVELHAEFQGGEPRFYSNGALD